MTTKPTSFGALTPDVQPIAIDSPALPLDIIERICMQLGDDIRRYSNLRESRRKASVARSTLACVMRTNRVVHDIAGRSLYRTLHITTTDFERVASGLKLKDCNSEWPNERSHSRKSKLLGFAHHLLLVGLPSSETSTRLMAVISPDEPLFRLVKTVAITDTFCMSVASHAIVESTTPDGDDLVEPHPFVDFLLLHVKPTMACLTYPAWEKRSQWIESFDIEAIRPWINLSDFNYHAEPSGFEIGFWGRIQLRRHYLGIMRRQKHQRFIDQLFEQWKPTDITLHNFDFAHSANPPNFACTTLHIFSCEEMCEHHPHGRYSHRPLLHSSDCLANRGSYWYRARNMLKKLAELPTRPKVVELGNVGSTFLLACACQNKFNNAVEGCKAALQSLQAFQVVTPHWSQVQLCECCKTKGPRGQDTLKDVVDDPSNCNDPHTWAIAVRLGNSHVSTIEDRESADYYHGYETSETGIGSDGAGPPLDFTLATGNW